MGIPTGILGTQHIICFLALIEPESEVGFTVIVVVQREPDAGYVNAIIPLNRILRSTQVLY